MSGEHDENDGTRDFKAEGVNGTERETPAADKQAKKQRGTPGLTVAAHVFEGRLVRTVERDGEPWFVAADVCRALGLAAHNGAYWQHLAKLDDDEKQQIGRDEILAAPTSSLNLERTTHSETSKARKRRDDDPLRFDTNPATSVISESGLYTLILRSRAATTPGTFAHRFRRWVTREVLPAIRREGRYARPDTAADEIADLPLRRFVTTVVAGRFHTYEQPPEFVIRDLDEADSRIIAHQLQIAELLYLKIEQRLAMGLSIADDPTFGQLGKTIRISASGASWWLRPEATEGTRH